MNIKNGDVFDIGQTVNGVYQFLWFNDKWYYFVENLTREYEYNQKGLTQLVELNEFEEISHLGNILDNFKLGKMNKLEEMFLTQGVVWDDDVQICAEIVQEVAIKYYKYFVNSGIEYIDNTEEGDVYKSKLGKKLTEDEIFKHFIKTL